MCQHCLMSTYKLFKGYLAGLIGRKSSIVRNPGVKSFTCGQIAIWLG